jgi:hypothetical protein
MSDLSSVGIRARTDGKYEVDINHGYCVVKDFDSVIRQQEHIIENQIDEQEKNAEIGKTLLAFYSDIIFLPKMTRKNLGEKKYHDYLAKFCFYADSMKNKKNNLRKEEYDKLVNVYTMLGKNNIPASNWSAKAAIIITKKRWFINKKVIEKAKKRLSILNKIKTL